MSNDSLVLEKLLEQLNKWASPYEEVAIIRKPELTRMDTGLIRLLFVMMVGSEETKLTIKCKEEDFLRSGLDAVVMDSLVNKVSNGLEVLRAKAFYADYEVAFEHNFERAESIVLTSANLGQCRFCRRNQPEVTFNKAAHAIPASIGNTTLYSSYECDECNAFFGAGIEDQFGLWSNVQRTMFGVPNRDNRTPILTMKGGYVKSIGDTTQIKIPRESMAKMSADEKSMRVELISPSHIPAAVMKAFNKMALSVMPDSEMHNFESTLNWIKDKQHRTGRTFFTLLSTFCPLQKPTRAFCLLLRRRTTDMTKPYMTFVLAFGKMCYQIVLSATNDKQSDQCSVTPFFLLYDSSAEACANYRTEEMAGVDIVKNAPLLMELAISGPVKYSNTAAK